VAEGLDGIQSRGALDRVDAEKDADNGGQGEGLDGRPERDNHLHVGQGRNGKWNGDAEGDSHGDLVQGDFFGFKGSAASTRQHLAVAATGGFEWDEDPSECGVGGRGVEGGLGSGGTGSRFHDADHTEVIQADPDIAAERVLGGEQFQGDLVAQDTHGLGGVHFDVIEETSRLDALIPGGGMVGKGAYNLGIDPAGDVPELLSDDASGNDQFDAGDGQERTQLVLPQAPDAELDRSTEAIVELGQGHLELRERPDPSD